MNHAGTVYPGLPENDPPLAAIFRHNLWANLRLLDFCAALDAQQLAATAAGTYGAIYDTLTHVVRGEQGYWLRISGSEVERRLQPGDRPDLATLREHARQSGEGLIEFASRVAPSDAVEVAWEDGGSRRVPSSLILAQAITHAAEHREQVTLTLTGLGVEPPALSVWDYLDEHVPPTPKG